jgi:hypothetical protein
MTDVQAAMGLPPAQVSRLLAAATRAPSIHNTQPWLFRLTPSSIELHLDLDRRLRVADPDGIEQRMSCGAALFNLRLALTQLGLRPDVTIMPDGDRPTLLAILRAAGRKHPNPEETALARAIFHRFTNRRSFNDDPVSSAHQHHLRAAAHREGAHLHLIDDHERRSELGRLSLQAHRQQMEDPGFRAELAQWTGHPGPRADGVPARAGGPAAAYDESWVLRDFTGGRPVNPVGHTGFERKPLIAVLSMYTTGPASDLRAGEALQRVLLSATVDGLSVSPVSQLIEVPEVRVLTGRLIGSPQPPHAVLRIGYGWPVVSSPRRAVDELVMPESSTTPAAAKPTPTPVTVGADSDPHDRSQLW